MATNPLDFMQQVAKKAIAYSNNPLHNPNKNPLSVGDKDQKAKDSPKGMDDKDKQPEAKTDSEDINNYIKSYAPKTIPCICRKLQGNNSQTEEIPYDKSESLVSFFDGDALMERVRESPGIAWVVDDDIDGKPFVPLIATHALDGTTNVYHVGVTFVMNITDKTEGVLCTFSKSSETGEAFREYSEKLSSLKKLNKPLRERMLFNKNITVAVGDSIGKPEGLKYKIGKITAIDTDKKTMTVDFSGATEAVPTEPTQEPQKSYLKLTDVEAKEIEGKDIYQLSVTGSLLVGKNNQTDRNLFGEPLFIEKSSYQSWATKNASLLEDFTLWTNVESKVVSAQNIQKSIFESFNRKDSIIKVYNSQNQLCYKAIKLDEQWSVTVDNIFVRMPEYESINESDESNEVEEKKWIGIVHLPYSSSINKKADERTTKLSVTAIDGEMARHNFEQYIRRKQKEDDTWEGAYVGNVSEYSTEDKKDEV